MVEVLPGATAKRHPVKYTVTGYDIINDQSTGRRLLRDTMTATNGSREVHGKSIKITENRNEALPKNREKGEKLLQKSLLWP